MVRNKVAICKNYHIQPSEMDRLQFWEYEYYLAEINNDVEAEKEREAQESQRYEMPSQSSFKMPDFSNMQMPSFSMPNM